MLNGEARDEVAGIVEERVRPMETSHSYLRATVSGLKGEFAELHQSLTHISTDQQRFHHSVTDQLSSLRTQVRATAADLAAFRNEVDARFEHVESRLGQVESRLGQVESRLGQVESRLGQVESRLGQVESQLEAIHAQLGRVTETLQVVVDRLD